MKPFLHQDGFDISSYFSDCKTIIYEPDQLICDLDMVSESIFLLRSGVVRASILSLQGSERLLFYGHAGCFIGDTMCFGRPNDLPNGVRALAVTHCEIAKMSQREMRAKCLQSPDLMTALLSRAYYKVSSLIEQLGYATFHDTTSQVAALVYALWLESKRMRGSGEEKYLLHMTHQMIAATTGRTRVSVTYALNRLQTLGAIKLHRRRVEVSDEFLLARYANEAEEVVDWMEPPNQAHPTKRIQQRVGLA